MSILVGVTLEQRKKAFQALSLHPQLQLRLWSGEHPLSSQDMAENFMAGWLSCHVGYPEREKAASFVAKGATLEEIKQATSSRRQGFRNSIPDVQMLYEWIDDKDRVVYVGITKDLRKRRTGHDRFRSKPGMKMRMVGYGTVDDETALIHKHLLNGAFLFNIKVAPLRGLDVFCDCSASCLIKMQVVGIETKIPFSQKLRLDAKEDDKSESLRSAMRWNARIMVEKSLTVEARLGIDQLAYHGSRRSLGPFSHQTLSARSIASDNLFPMSTGIEFIHCMRRPPQALIQSEKSGREPFVIPTWNRHVEAIEAICENCGSLGLSPAWSGRSNLVHVDTACCYGN